MIPATQFNIKRTTQFGKVYESIQKLRGVGKGSFKWGLFLVSFRAGMSNGKCLARRLITSDGTNINESDTAEILDMEDGDSVEFHVAQVSPLTFDLKASLIRVDRRGDKILHPISVSMLLCYSFE